MPTAQDYDAIPYEDCPLNQTSPNNLSVIANLFGVKAVLPDQCRVLELGCAAGGNIIPMAYYWPDSEFVGVELSEKQAEQASQLVQQLELDNIKIIQGDILALDESLGSFDFIIAHGVYSWVPETVKDYMFVLLQKLLVENGVAFISYNTFPGWHSRMAVREMMLHHGRDAVSVEEKLSKGRELLQLMAHGLPDNSSLSEQWYKNEMQMLLGLSPSYLLHDYLEENNQPVYFYQFMEKASAYGLQYLAEADLYTMLGSTLTPQAERVLDNIDDLVQYEQYLDFYYLRYFRQTLLCHENLDVSRELDLDLLTNFYFSTLLTTDDKIDLYSTEPQAFKHPGGTSFDISHPLTKAALVELSQHYPNSYSYLELLERAQLILQQNDSEYAVADPDVMLSELFNLYVSQGIGLSRVSRDFPVASFIKPKATLLAKVYAQQEKCCVASVHHDNIPLDVFDRYLILLMDGHHSQEEINDLILEKIEKDSDFRQQVVGERRVKDIKPDFLNNKIEQSLYFFAVNGLLQSG